MNEPENNPTLYKVPSTKEGQRLDNYLIPILKIPRSLLYKSLRKGSIRLNAGKSKPCCRIKSDDIITVRPHLINIKPHNNNSLERKKSYDVSWLAKKVVFENSDFMIIDKPAKLAVHGGSGDSLGLIEMARLLKKESHDDLQLVHRLDKETSGLVILSKKRSALVELSKLFQERKIQKTYYALLSGDVKKTLITQDPLLTIRSKDGLRRAIFDPEKGKEAVSKFIPQFHTKTTTLCQVSIQTGRMHQIRAHASLLKSPIIGDKLYSSKFSETEHLHLHAFKLDFIFKGKNYTFISELPKYWLINHLLENKDGPWNLKTKNLPQHC